MKREVLVVSAVAAMIAALPVVAAEGKALDGKAVFEKSSCAGCHRAMNPKLGDKAAWAPLIKGGTDALVASTIKGKGAMPARGGTKLSNDEIKAAVEYMLSQVK